MESIRKFVDEFHACGKKLDMLFNCHGFKPGNSTTQICLSADNFELTMAANHLGLYTCCKGLYMPCLWVEKTSRLLATTATFIAVVHKEVVHPGTRISFLFAKCRYLSIFGILPFTN